MNKHRWNMVAVNGDIAEKAAPEVLELPQCGFFRQQKAGTCSIQPSFDEMNIPSGSAP